MRLSVYELPGSGTDLPSILFCHAAGFHARVWNQVSRCLPSSNARFALDFHGHGQSPPLPTDATWDRFRDDIADAVEQLGGQRFVGVGHSLGGTALLLAEAAAPGMFERLLCYEPILASDDDPTFATAAARRKNDFASPDEALRRFSTRGPFARLESRVLRDYVEGGLAADPSGGVRLRCPPHTEEQIYLTARTAKWPESLPHVRCPVEFGYGTKSTVADHTWLTKFAAAMPHAHTFAMPEFGHLGPLERPAKFASWVAELV
ncbi:alpha/beta fold hydrolase [Nocardia sp. NBC_01388]|uniref:alpha/beta fold hydrolase n=1 Tax=Nocardia sp. NBC_01388 TaxID=2903596 RepID=UPI00324D79D1